MTKQAHIIFANQDLELADAPFDQWLSGANNDRLLLVKDERPQQELADLLLELNSDDYYITIRLHKSQDDPNIQKLQREAVRQAGHTVIELPAFSHTRGTTPFAQMRRLKRGAANSAIVDEILMESSVRATLTQLSRLGRIVGLRLLVDGEQTLIPLLGAQNLKADQTAVIKDLVRMHLSKADSKTIQGAQSRSVLALRDAISSISVSFIE